MRETAQIVRAWREAAVAGRPAVLATVVSVRGSAYRRPGARMLIPLEGEPVGLVSGGCLEADLADRARDVLAEGRPRTVLYDMRSPDDVVWGLGLGCNGEVRVLLEPLSPEAASVPLETLERCARRRRAAAVVTVIDGDVELPLGSCWSLAAGDDDLSGPSSPETAVQTAHDVAQQTLATRTTSTVEALPGVTMLAEYVAPPIALAVFGAGLDVLPVTELAHQLGWPLTVIDRRDAAARADRFPCADRVVCSAAEDLAAAGLTIDDRTAVVIMTHHFLDDVALLAWLLDTPAPYIGCLGPAQRTVNLLGELARRGIEPGEASRERIHGPLGLDIGAESPEEIALSMVAEIRAVLSGRSGGRLREQRGPLHEAAT